MTTKNYLYKILLIPVISGMLLSCNNSTTESVDDDFDRTKNANTPAEPITDPLLIEINDLEPDSKKV